MLLTYLRWELVDLRPLYGAFSDFRDNIPIPMGRFLVSVWRNLGATRRISVKHIATISISCVATSISRRA